MLDKEICKNLPPHVRIHSKYVKIRNKKKCFILEHHMNLRSSRPPSLSPNVKVHFLYKLICVWPQNRLCVNHSCHKRMKRKFFIDPFLATDLFLYPQIRYIIQVLLLCCCYCYERFIFLLIFTLIYFLIPCWINKEFVVVC